jgi:hypothetical protein
MTWQQGSLSIPVIVSTLTLPDGVDVEIDASLQVNGTMEAGNSTISSFYIYILKKKEKKK